MIDPAAMGLASTCEPILRALPEWFGIESAIVDYVRDIDRLPTSIARVEGDPVGFVTIRRHFPTAAEVHVMAIEPAFHRRGIGRDLIAAAVRDEAAAGVEFLQVKTVGPSSDDASYARTRRFYESVGFRPLEEIPTLWDVRNPCLILVKSIGGGSRAR